MLFAIVAGLVWGGGAPYLTWSVMPALGIIMVISTLSITGDSLRSATGLVGSSLTGIGMNYLFHASLLLGLNYIFIDDPALYRGFVILAAVPPAVAVIPFTLFLGGNNNLSLIGTVGAYLAALLIQPLIVVGLLGSEFVNPWKLVATLFELIVLPLVLSRVFIYTGLSKKMEPLKGPLTNWAFFIVVYTMVGLNRDLFLAFSSSLVPVLGLAFLSTFGFGWVIGICGKVLGTGREKATSLLLLGTFKNYGLAGGLALFFFDEKTAVPATVTSVVGILYIVWLDLWKHRAKRNETTGP